MLPCVKADIAGDTYSIVTLRGNLFSGWGPSVRLPPRLLHALSLSLLLKKKKKKNSRTRRFPRAAIICLSRSWSVAVYSWLCFAFSLPSKQSEWKDRQDLKKSLTMCFVQMRQNSIPVSIFIFLVYYHYDLQHFSSNELVHF